ncbi:MAG: MarR family winged helix-turn-helix transcriptional regulator [Chloroflexota bacterium]
MRTEREKLLEDVIEGQRLILRATHAASTTTWLELQLTMAQLKALFVLDQAPRSVTEVGEALGTGKAAASLLVERLVHLGLVDRTEDPLDRRRTLTHLTPQAELSFRQLREAGRERYRDWVGLLNDDDLAALAQGIQALARVIKECDEQLSPDAAPVPSTVQ